MAHGSPTPAIGGLRPETILIQDFHNYVVGGVEPAYSGRNNLVTVGLIEAMGVSSSRSEVVDFKEFMALFTSHDFSTAAAEQAVAVGSTAGARL